MLENDGLKIRKLDGTFFSGEVGTGCGLKSNKKSVNGSLPTNSKKHGNRNKREKLRRLFDDY